MKDVYVYMKCKKCGNPFRVVKSGLGRRLFIGHTNEIMFLLECSRCGLRECERITKKEWIKSNEVKPDNVYICSR